MTEYLEHVTRQMSKNSTGSVIWLHGLGADGHDFSDIVPALNLPSTLSLRFIFPHAPERPVTINAQRSMRAWYDIYHLDRLNPEDEVGMAASEKQIHNLIQQELDRGIPSHRIVLAGFSQGGAMALYTGLRYPKPLAGILALSCYLPCPHATEEKANPVNKDIPILMTHGLKDDVLPIELAQTSYQQLQKLHYPIIWREYPMQHQVCQPELVDIADWLVQRFS